MVLYDSSLVQSHCILTKVIIDDFNCTELEERASIHQNIDSVSTIVIGIIFLNNGAVKLFVVELVCHEGIDD
jgi:hypothetical protein